MAFLALVSRFWAIVRHTFGVQVYPGYWAFWVADKLEGSEFRVLGLRDSECHITRRKRSWGFPRNGDPEFRGEHFRPASFESLL